MELLKSARRPVMPLPSLEAAVTLSREELKALWVKLFGHPAPPRFRRELLLAFVAYRLQEKRLGGLSAQARKELRSIAEAVGRNKAYRPASVPAYKPGTRLIRRWGGEVHEVTVLAKGYAYRGDLHGSLSEIARLITGTRWNGQAFFGQRSRRKARDLAAPPGTVSSPSNAGALAAPDAARPRKGSGTRVPEVTDAP
jgi:hypothetical protein